MLQKLTAEATEQFSLYPETPMRRSSPARLDFIQ
jgi:hypothetical protein